MILDQIVLIGFVVDYVRGLKCVQETNQNLMWKWERIEERKIVYICMIIMKAEPIYVEPTTDGF